MIKKILLGLAVFLGVFLIVAAFQPADYRIVRSASIAAPPAVVFAQVNDFHQWTAWSPWEKLDPAMKKTFEGPSAGTGAAYSWSGNSDVGEGRCTILQSRPNDLLKLRLDFVKPFASTASTDFTFKTEAGQTAVTWSMEGKNNYLSKVMCLAMSVVTSMDKMVGGQFEEGLANLKAVSEAAAKK